MQQLFNIKHLTSMTDDIQEEFDEQEELYEHYRFAIEKGQKPERLDKYLVNHMPNVTRNRIQNGCVDGNVLVNGKTAKSSYQIKPLDVITIVLPQPVRAKELIPQDLPINIVYEDEDVIIINKEPGMVVHPAFGNYSGTLMNAMVFHFQNLPVKEGSMERPGLVHRIDKNTSGLMVIARSEGAMNKLAKEFFDRTIDRKYIALVWGDFKEDTGTITG